MNEIDKLKQLASDTTATNKLVVRFERVIDQENATSIHVCEAASFLIASALSRHSDPMTAWSYFSERIKKAIKEGFDSR
jgi:hypothetical protein